MCGRFSLATTKEKLQLEFPFLQIEEAPAPNYNVAPTQPAAVIPNDEPATLKLFIWGLVPHWDKEGKPTGKLINARAETVAEKPSFRRAFSRQRCIVPADSFYEWKKIGNKKVPYRILRKDGRLLAFAGIWDVWTDGLTALHTFSIITTDPNEEVATIHDRMPVVLLDEDQQLAWLEEHDLEKLKKLLVPPPDGIFEMYPVSTAVNNPKNNSPALHDPWLPPATLF